MVDLNVDNEFIIGLWETIEKYVSPSSRNLKAHCIKDILLYLESRGFEIEPIISDLFNYSITMDRAIDLFLKERENMYSDYDNEEEEY